MHPDPLDKIQTLLFQEQSLNLALLLDLTSLLPDSMLDRAISLAKNADDKLLRAFLLRALAKRLPTRSERQQLIKDYPVPPGYVVADVCIPEGKKARRLIARLSEAQRREVFDRLLLRMERRDSSKLRGGGEVAGKSIENVPERRDIVNLGFSRAAAADQTLTQHQPLQPRSSYYFWLNIGSAHKDAIGQPTRLHLKRLPKEARLMVAIFGFENELQIVPGEDIGELQVQKNGTVKVVRQPMRGETESIPLSPNARFDYLEDYLLFPIRTPSKPGVYRLRCNIYCAQVLVQSYLVSAMVNGSPSVSEAYSKKLDYVLSETLRPAHLASMTAEPHLLSLLINSDGNGSNNFRFFGADGALLFKDDAQVDGQTLTGLLKQARRAMHKVSWGDENEWAANPQVNRYRYHDQPFDRARLAKDLAYLARAGWRIYNTFLQHLPTTAPQLGKLLANSGAVQIALKLSPRAVLPAAVVYDYAWKPDHFRDFDNTPFELCPTFSAAIDAARNDGPPLEESICFKGDCALKAEIARVTAPDSGLTLRDLPPIICPSGFWGYRHSLGLPLTLDGANSEAPPVIGFKDDLQMIACISTDPLLVERDNHLGRLQKLKHKLKFVRNENYNEVVTRLKQTAPHLLYFYCHGGIRANTNLPYLEIGESDRIGPEDLVGEGITWNGPHPLVFINGCHTTALNPEITLDFVSSFVQEAGASGVIGTEITIFEPLAAEFAEECLSRFVEGVPIGRAVRGARLELLRQGNPLGLVYIPFSIASLRLQNG